MHIIIKLDDDTEMFLLYDSIKLSNLINKMDLENGDIIPINNIDFQTMTHVIKYCKHYYDRIPQYIENTKLNETDDGYSRIKSQWDIEFIKEFTFDEVLKITNAALFLDIEPLLLLGSLHMSILLKDLPTDEIRRRLQIENDFSEDDEKLKQNVIQYCCSDE